MSIVNLENKTILVTGAAGFIGSNLVKRIYQEAPSATVIGIDNMNADDYYGKESIMCSPFEDGIVNGTGFYRLNIRFFSRSCSRYLK